ncbi:hypothetical protein D4Z78_24015 [Okeania hirsuta]|nr:hypothetical protein D4Z78_31560 [Okeania hirsuta]RQH13416.1 hypothetical protein D4Z78_24015 [Okeania hirsuta]
MDREKWTGRQETGDRRQEKWIGSEEVGVTIVNLGFFCPTLAINTNFLSVLEVIPGNFLDKKKGLSLYLSML